LARKPAEEEEEEEEDEEVVVVEKEEERRREMLLSPTFGLENAAREAKDFGEGAPPPPEFFLKTLYHKR